MWISIFLFLSCFLIVLVVIGKLHCQCCGDRDIQYMFVYVLHVHVFHCMYTCSTFLIMSIFGVYIRVIGISHQALTRC